jgi:hypothetical protein
MFYDLAGIISLLLVIWGIVAVVQCGESTTTKVVWILILVVLQVFGFVIWFIMGPGSKEFPLRR